MAVLRKDDEGQKKLFRLADALVNSGLAGDVSALKEIGDRLDGKVSQPLTGGDGEGPITVVVRKFSDG